MTRITKLLETPYYPHRVQETRQLLQDLAGNFYLEEQSCRLGDTQHSTQKATRIVLVPGRRRLQIVLE